MPKTLKTKTTYELGERVIYLKKNQEYWVHEKKQCYITLKPCFQSSSQCMIEYLPARDAVKYLKKFTGRQPKKNQLVLLNMDKIHKAIIVDVSEKMTIQIISTRVNYTLDINSLAVKLLDEYMPDYIPYNPICLSEEKLLYAEVIVGDMRGILIDYDATLNLYIFLHWDSGEHKLKSVSVDEMTVIKERRQPSNPTYIGTLKCKMKSSYPEKMIKKI